jgi:protein MpaA
MDERHSHNYPLLARRWRSLARQCGLQMKILIKTQDLPIYWLQSKAATKGHPIWYFSAGVHGDEAGATAGLIRWAENAHSFLTQNPVIIFPCLNPHGLTANTRLNENGQDLNRRFHLKTDPIIAAWRQILTAAPPHIATCLHEDYDAHGCYLYELNSSKKPIGHSLLEQATNPAIPIDQRRNIDGVRSHHGLIHRRQIPQHLPGTPEAVELFNMGCPLTLTFETPSELHINDRAAAHQRFLDALIQH